MPRETAFRKYSDLADGETLAALKQGYLRERDRDSLVSLLSCLRESFVRVPMTVEMSDNDRARLEKAAAEGTLKDFTAEDEVRMRPEILTTPDGRRFFPMFSRKCELKEDFARQYSVFEEAVPNCIAMAKRTEGLNGLVLDAFTQPFIIPFDVAEMILNAKRMHS